MRLDLEPKIEALLKAQVAAGHYKSVEEAIKAAVLGVAVDDEKLTDLSWAQAYIDEAEAALTDGQSVDEPTAYGALEQRLGRI